MKKKKKDSRYPDNESKKSNKFLTGHSVKSSNNVLWTDFWQVTVWSLQIMYFELISPLSYCIVIKSCRAELSFLVYQIILVIRKSLT